MPTTVGATTIAARPLPAPSMSPNVAVSSAAVGPAHLPAVAVAAACDPSSLPRIPHATLISAIAASAMGAAVATPAVLPATAFPSHDAAAVASTTGHPATGAVSRIGAVCVPI